MAFQDGRLSCNGGRDAFHALFQGCEAISEGFDLWHSGTSGASMDEQFFVRVVHPMLGEPPESPAEEHDCERADEGGTDGNSYGLKHGAQFAKTVLILSAATSAASRRPVME